MANRMAVHDDREALKEIIAIDVEAIDSALKILSAKVAGESPIDLKPNMAVYARIAGYYKGEQVKTVARMFWALTQDKQISGFQCKDYARLLPQIRRDVKARLKMGFRKPKPCMRPEEHRQPCFCGNYQRGVIRQQEKEAGL